MKQLTARYLASLLRRHRALYMEVTCTCCPEAPVRRSRVVKLSWSGVFDARWDVSGYTPTTWCCWASLPAGVKSTPTNLFQSMLDHDVLNGYEVVGVHVSPPANHLLWRKGP